MKDTKVKPPCYTEDKGKKKMPKLLGLTGYKQVGKDTAAEILGWKRVAFADALKEEVYALNPPLTYTVDIELGGGNCFEKVSRPLQRIIDEDGWEEAKEKYPEVRQWLVDFGAHQRNFVHEDYWLDKGMQKAWDYLEQGHNVIITDCRYANEIDRVKTPQLLKSDEGGLIRVDGKVLWVESPGYGPNPNHQAEIDIPTYNWDDKITNCRTEAYALRLFDKVHSLFEDM